MAMNIKTFHPLVILAFFVGVSVTTMLTMHPFLLATCFVCSFINLWYEKRGTGLKLLLQIMSPVALFAVVILPLFSHRGETALFYLNGLAVTKEQIFMGVILCFLFATVFSWVMVAREYLDEEKILYLFGAFLPVIGLMVSMVFRMLPMMRRRYREISEGMQGLLITEQNKTFPSKVRFEMKKISILIAWTLEQSMETSISMESRGYGVKRKRSSFHLFHFYGRDAVALILCIIIFTLTFIWESGKYASCFPVIRYDKLEAFDIVWLLVVSVISLFPVWGMKE